MIEFDLNTHDGEALLRHSESFVPEDDDPRGATLAGGLGRSSRATDRAPKQGWFPRIGTANAGSKRNEVDRASNTILPSPPVA